MSGSKSRQNQLNSDSGERPRVRRIGALVNQLMSRRGYAQSMAGEDMHQSLVAEIGAEIAADCMIGNLRAGVLQIHVSNSATLQELNFRKRGILKRLQKELPESKIADIKFRIHTT